jgi:hypothetical protein
MSEGRSGWVGSLKRAIWPRGGGIRCAEAGASSDGGGGTLEPKRGHRMGLN